MRLTPDLIRGAPAYMNPLKERELSLRGYKISKIENLGVTEDQYDVIDLSDNEILKLENFPLLQRLQALLLNNNRLCRIAKGLEEFLPRLVTLILTGNKLTNLSDIDNLSTLPRLSQLSLLNNPVTKQESYRLYVIHKFPKLKVLDFRRIKPKERKEAVKKFGVLEEDIKGEKDSTKTSAKTFVVGDGVPQTQTQTKKKGLTSDQKRKIMEAIKKATSLGEIERLEKILSSGKIPSDFDLDPTQPKETKSVSVSESENNTDPSQTGSKKNPDGDSSEPETKQDSKGTDAKAEKNKGKDSSAGEKEKSEKATPKGGEDGNPVEGEGETEGLADQEADEETDTSTRWEKADAQVDIEMAE